MIPLRSFMKRHFSGVRASVFAAALLAASAQAAFFDNSAVEPNEYFEEGPAWKELELALPALPQESDLLKIEFNNASTNEEFIDGKTLDVGKDGIARVSLVSRHRSGTETVTREGIRCSTAQYRIYAIKNGDEWIAPKASIWRDIPLGRYRTLRSELYTRVLCKDGFPKKVDQVIKDIRYPTTERNW